MIRQYELVDRVRAYNANVDETMLNRAYVFAMKAHGSQKRYSGDPYFSHPLEVAGILTNLKLDEATIATALLHDTIEDTDTTHEEIDEAFGPEVARLIDGVTKLTKLELVSEHTQQAENFRKLILAMSSDIRVLLVKLADRLHNMRTLHFIPKPEKRRRIAQETLDIYAPLAGRIGMQEMREELEDLAFAELNPDARASILARLEFLRKDAGDLIERIASELHEKLSESGVEATVLGREKRPFSIWTKMERKTISFEQLSDIVAFRVIVPSLPDCYRALGIVHQTWQMVPGRFKDYISTPKRNNYRSIHTTVIGPERQRVEMQIRSVEMHEVAERGVAAHWTYKEQGSGPIQDAAAYRWLRELVEMLDQGDSVEEFLEHSKLEMFHDQVFCFTPRGALIGLPRGATPIDFAYAVHTEIGDHCVGAKVNGQRVPLRTVLQNGDQVEILRSDAQTPSPAWESFVITGKARAAIRRHIRDRNREQYVRLGRTLLERAFGDAGYAFSEKAVAEALIRLKAAGVDDVLAQIGQGLMTCSDAIAAIFPESKPKPARRTSKRTAKGTKRLNGRGAAEKMPIEGLMPGMAVHMADCCRPLPGDRIVGVVTPGRGMIVHTIDCEELAIYDPWPESWVDISWSAADAMEQRHVGRLVVETVNERGSLGSVATIIGKNDGNIDNLHIAARTPDHYQIVIDVEVRDVKHLQNVMSALRAAPAVSKVERWRSEARVNQTA